MDRRSLESIPLLLLVLTGLIAGCSTPYWCPMVQIKSAEDAAKLAWAYRRSERIVEEHFDPVDESLVRAVRDRNSDGRPDRWDHFRPGARTPYRIEVDTDGDGAPDVWGELDAEGKTVSARKDVDRDGIPDQTLDPDEAATLWPKPGYPAAKLDDPAQDRTPLPNCDDSADCLAFLRKIHEKVYRRWRVPQGFGSFELSIAFSLDENGGPYDAEARNRVPRALEYSVFRALSDSAPFRVPEEVAFLHRQRIVATFRVDEEALR